MKRVVFVLLIEVGGFLDYVLRHGMQVSGASVSVNQEKNVVRDLFKTVFVMDVQLPGPCGGVADNVTDMMSALLHTIGQIDNNLGMHCDCRLRLLIGIDCNTDCIAIRIVFLLLHWFCCCIW